MPDRAGADRWPGAALGLTSLLVAGFESFGHGLAVLDAQGRLRYANGTARSLLAQWGWLGGPDHNACALPAAWRDALLTVCLKARRELVKLPAGGPHTGPRAHPAGDAAPGYAAIVPIDSDGQRLAFVIFGRQELCGAVELEMFALRHGLTATESEVLRQLCRGFAAADIARDRNVALTTVLTQIGAIRQKTDCRTVRQLLHALSRMPQLRAAA